MRIKKKLSLFMAMIMILTLLPVNAFAVNNIVPPMLTKTAEWVNQSTGLAKITMTAKGTPVDVTAKSGADVLLVLDASGSMDDHATEKCGGDLELKESRRWGYYYQCPECGKHYSYDSPPSDLKCTEQIKMDESRWQIAQEAAGELTNQVIPNDSTANRMGTILFSADSSSSASDNYYGDHDNAIKEYQDFTNNKSEIVNTWNTSPSGGTDYTGALQKAFDMIDSRADKSRPVYLIFLSDGAPGGWSGGWSSGNRIGDEDWNGANEMAQLKSTSDNNDVSIYTVGFGLDDNAAIQLLQGYATQSAYAYNITNGSELSGLFTEIGNTIESGVTIWDNIDSRYFTLANKPGTDQSYFVNGGTVQCTNDTQFVWNLDNFSESGKQLEIYIQLKSQYLNTNTDYPTNELDSAFGKYVDTSGSKADLPVSTTNGSTPVPRLNTAANTADINFTFVGTNPEKASFNTPAQASQSVQIGSTVTSPGVTVAAGYQITAWYPTANCTGVPFNFSTAISTNVPIHLYASVDANASAKYAYTVNFYKNGTLSENVAGEVWAGAPTVTVGNAKALKTGNYSNYSFTEATVDAQHYTLDADEIAIAANGSTVIAVYYTAGAVDLTFQRGEHGKFSAVADQNESSVTKSTHYDASFNSAPGIDADLGWQQVGWYEAGDVAQTIVHFPQTVTSAKTYVMKYEKQAADWKSVTFNLNDGTATPYRVVNDILVGTTISNGDWPTKPDKDGYEFIGWFTQDGTNDNWGTQFTQSSAVNADATVYAKWRKTKTDVPVHYYLGSVSGTELTFSQAQKISGAIIGNSFTDYINDALKEKGTEATNQSSYYNISKENAVVMINGAALGTQTVADGDSIQVVYTAKMGSFQVRDYFPDSTPAYGQYISEYEASLAHGSTLKYGASKTDLTITAVNSILSDRLSAVRANTPGAKIKSVSIEYEDFNANGVAEWQTPVTATLNAEGTAVTSFTGLDQLTIHGGCETRLVFEYEFPITVQVEYHKQSGDTDNYENIDGTSYVIGGGTSYVYKNDMLNIVQNANSLNNINKVVPVGAEGYTVARVATAAAPSTSITANQYQVAAPTTFIVYLDAITADGGKIVNVDNNGSPLEGAAFTFNNADLSAGILHKNEYSIAQDFVYGVEYTVTQTASTPGYTKVADFKVKLKADGTGLELVGAVQNVTIDGMTITVANEIDTTQKFAYTVNRYIKDTNTPVPGLPAITGEHELGIISLTDEPTSIPATTATGYKLVTTPVQPTSLTITADATKNVENVYYEVDDAQTRSYKISYWIDGEAAPFSSLDNQTVLEADPKVAYGDIPMNNIPVGYKLKGVEFAGNAVNSTQQVVITSLDNEIRVIYQKDSDMWVTVAFSAGDHGTWADGTTPDVVINAIKGTAWSNYSSQVPATPVQSGIGWKLANEAQVWNQALLGDNDLVPNTDMVYTAQWTADNADVSFEIVGETHGAVEPNNVPVQKGTATTAPSVTANKGYEVKGWYTDEECQNAFDFTNTITQDTPLYAKVVEKVTDWTTITFNTGEHGKWSNNTTADVVVKAIKGAAWSNYSTQVPPSPVQSEIGWKLADATWDPALPSASDVIPDAGLVYTAQWVADNATVSFEIVGDDLHGAVNPANAAVQKGTATSAPSVTANKGYEVKGWYTDEECQNAFDFTNAITQNTPLYAKVVEKAADWTTITFNTGEHGKWSNNTTADVVVKAIKGATWSNYSTQVPPAPVQSEIGWKLADATWDPALPSASDVIPDAGLVYTAQWVADNATVSFEIVGDDLHGAVNPANAAVQKGTATSAPSVTANKGYEVKGWYTDEECQNAFDFTNTITQDTPLYAKVVEKAADWTTITFNTGEHGKWSNNTTADVVVKAIKGAAWSNYSTQVPPAPVQSEIGWKLADATWDPALPSASDVIPDAGLVYTAQWVADNADVSFEIVGDLHGAVNPANVAVQKGTATTAPSVTANKGYEVKGWYTDEECQNAFDFTNTITQDTPLYAKVVEKATDWTTITFNTGEHGKWSNNTTADVVVKAIKGAAWSNYSTQVPPAPVQSEIGWKLADATWDPALPSASDVIPDAGLVYTAQWVADNADVSFEIVGDLHGAVNPANVAVQKGTATTAPSVTANKGYEVKGWYTDDTCTTAFDFTDAITQDTTLFAKVVVKAEDWTTITFEPGYVGKWADGSQDFVVIDAIKGAPWSDYSTQVPPAPVQSEIGWKLTNEAQVWHQALPNATDKIPDNGLTYTAVWTRDNATVSFEIVGELHGAVNPADATVQKGKTTGAPAVVVNKGYKVDGWYTDEACTTAFSFGDTVLKDMKLYAKIVEKAADWTTITFAAGDHGKWSNDTTTDVVVKAIKGAAWSDYSNQVPPAPVQSEIGWKLADGTWNPALPSASEVIPDAGLVYTAQWVADNADVSFEIVGEPHGAVNPSNAAVQKGTATTAPVVTADQGYQVDGWYTDADCTTAFDFSNAITEDTPLFAKVVMKEGEWATVTFNAGTNGTINAGSGDVTTVVTDPILLRSTISSAIPTVNANAGFEFDAWYRVTEGETGTTETLETPVQGTTVVEGDMTYLAKFASLLNVTFNVNTTKAAEGTTSPVTISGISKGTLWTAIQDQVPEIVGRVRENEYSHDYEFTGWKEAFPDTVTSNLTFTAEFDDVYSFVVEHADINDDASPEDVYKYEEVIPAVKRKAGEAIRSQANALVRGYELSNITVLVGDEPLEVSTTAELIETLKNNYNITLTEDGTLSGTMPEACIWIKYGYEKKAERTVKYETDGNVTGMPENITDRYEGDPITISGTPKRDGYDFSGWEVVDQVVAVTEGMFTMPDSDVVLKAIWTPNEEAWTYTVLHYLEGAETPFSTTQGSVLKRAPNIESVVLNAPQGYKFKEYQINGDPTELPLAIGENGTILSVVYEKNDLIVKHVYGDTTVYDTTQSKADAGDGSVVVNAVNSGRYTKLKAVTVNGVTVPASRSITLDFANTDKYEVVFVYGRKSSDSGDTPGGTNSNTNGSDFGEDVNIIDEEVPLADGLNMVDHFAYIFGYEDDTVRPTNRISREEVAAIFYRLLNDDTRAGMLSTSQAFPDVSSQRWSNKSIATLSNGEILSGYPSGEFKPGNAITRAEFAVIVSKFDNLSQADTNQFTDIENHWAKDFINSAALKGWISGYPDGTFHPDEYITRAEAMTLINSVLNRKVSKEGLLENAKYWSDNSKDAWYYEAVMEATNSHDYTRETPDGAETWTAITADKTWE